MRAALAALLALGLVGCPTVDDDDDVTDDDDSAPSDDDDSGSDDDDSGSDDDDDDVQPVTERMLVVYNAEDPDSQTVAEHYVAARGLPPEALCPTTPGDPVEVEVSVYSAGVATPVLGCIDGEWERYLLFVTVYGMPYRVTGSVYDISGSGDLRPGALDALLTRPFRHDELPLQVGWAPYAAAGWSEDGIYEEATPIAQWREESGETYYLVSRLDGATAEDAMRLVDDAIAAEEAAAAGELTGGAWVDRGWQDRGADDFGSYASVEWDLTRLAQVFEAAGFDLTYDETAAEVGTEPAPLTGDDALYYGGWYSFNNYNDVWDWSFGAISLHFDSCSACDPRGGPNWSANVLQRGAVATMGAVAEPYVAGLMSYDQFFLYLFQGASFAEAGYQSTPLSEWMAMFLGDPLYRPYGAEPLLPPDWQPPQL